MDQRFAISAFKLITATKIHDNYLKIFWCYRKFILFSSIWHGKIQIEISKQSSSHNVICEHLYAYVCNNTVFTLIFLFSEDFINQINFYWIIVFRMYIEPLQLSSWKDLIPALNTRIMVNIWHKIIQVEMFFFLNYWQKIKWWMLEKHCTL